MYQILNNFTLGAIERAVRAASGFFTAILVARNYSVNDFADYAFFTAILMTLLQIVKLGADDVISKQANHSLIKLKEYFVLKILFSVLLIIFLIFITAFTKYIDPLVTCTICFVVLISPAQTVITILQARGYFLRPLNHTILALSLSNLLKLLFITFTSVEPTFLALLDSFLISLFALKMINLRIVRIYFKRKLTTLNLNPPFQMAYPLLLSSIFISLYARIDILMLSWLSTSLETASYFTITRIIEAFTFLLPILNMLFLHYAKQNNNLSYKHMIKIGYMTSILAIILVVILCLCDVLRMFGDDFRHLRLELIIASFSLIPITLGSISNIWLIDHSLVKYKLIRTFVGLILNISLNFLLINLYGMLGAIIATFISQIFASILLNLLSPKTRPLFKLLILRG